jgi:hypothetical protein
VKCKGMKHPFIIKVHDVIDPYVLKGLIRSSAWKDDDLRCFVERVRAAHSYFFRPREQRLLRIHPEIADAEDRLLPTGTDESGLL